MTDKPQHPDRKEMLRNDDRPVKHHAGETTVEASAADWAAQTKGLLPGTQVDHFVIQDCVGAGGMGVVYRATDMILDRVVALKLLRIGDVRLAARMMSEARAQARIEHENVCKVYEVGESEQGRYIAMQFITGQTLGDAARQMRLREKVEVIRQIAEAMQAAHSLGIIHRDLKPSNIMVERQEGGLCKPYVLDFGLVRDLDAPGLTTTGAVLGTPCYMSPEQASGGRMPVDARADVYSLGATLYEVLLGRPPFEGSIYDVLRGIIEKDPPSVRSVDSKIPLDLNTVVMKCLEKDSKKRYQSAKGFAEDLRRFLDDEPILARRSSFAERALKRVRRQKALVAVAAVALIVVAAMAGYGIHARWKSSRMAAFAESYGQRAKEIELLMRTAYIRPLHDIRSEKTRAQELIRRLEKDVARDGILAIGPGHYALGRACLALHDYDKAYDHLKQSWEAAYREPELGYELGLAHGLLYQKALNVAYRGAVGKSRENLEKEARARYRDPALQYLAASARIPGISIEYVEGLIAFYEGQYDKAIASAEKAFEKSPWLVEARKLTGDAYRSRGYEKMWKGDLQGCIADYRAAVQSYKSCSEFLRSDPEIYDAEAMAWEWMLYAGYNMGRGDKETFGKALAACDACITANPDDESGYNRKSGLLWRWAGFVIDSGGDGRDFLEDSRKCAEQAIRCRPDDYLGYLNHGMALEYLGASVIETGGDAGTHLKAAVSSLRQSLQLAPHDTVLLYALGNALRFHASYQYFVGTDPSSNLQESEKIIRASIGKDTPTNRYIGLTYNLYTRAQYEAEQGQDPTQTLDKAYSTCMNALRLNPKFIYMKSLAGMLSCEMARIAFQRGKDPTFLLDRADSELQDSLQSTPIQPEVYTSLLSVAAIRAAYEMEQRRNPERFIEEGKRLFRESLAVTSTKWYVYIPAAALKILEARWAAQQQRPAQQYFKDALEGLDKAQALNSNDKGIYASVAEAYRWKAEYDLVVGISPVQDIQEGIDFAKRSIAANRRRWESEATCGAFELLRARTQASAQKRHEVALLAKTRLEGALQHGLLLQHTFAPLLKEAERLAGGTD